MYAQEVCLFGDSIARGVVLDAQDAYKPIKESFASLAATELGIALINKARFGCTITKGREIIEHYLNRNDIAEAGAAHDNADAGASASKAQADGVVEKLDLKSESRAANLYPIFRTPRALNARRFAFLEFGGNDCDFRWDQISANPRAEHLPATTPERFFAMYGEVINKLKSKGIQPVLMTLPPLDAERYFNWFTRTGLNKRAILDWLGDVQFIYRWHESYSSAIWEIGEAFGAPVADIRKIFLEQRNYSRFLCKDGIHPNAEGHQLIKTEIIALARQLIVE